MRSSPSEGSTTATDATQAGLQSQWRQLNNLNGTAAWELRCGADWKNGTKLWTMSPFCGHALHKAHAARLLNMTLAWPLQSPPPCACSGVPKPPLDLLIYPDMGRPLLAT